MSEDAIADLTRFRSVLPDTSAPPVPPSIVARFDEARARLRGPAREERPSAQLTLDDERGAA